MLGPHLRGRGIGGLVSIAQSVSAGRGIDTKVRVVVDDAGCHVLAAPIDPKRVWRSINRGAHSCDLSILQQNRAVPDQGAGRGENVDVANDRCAGWEWDVDARK